MAPEQMQPGFKLDARADVYALATIAYHMLGGRPPFTGDFTQLIAQKLTQPPPPLTTLRSDISTDVERVIMSGLARELSERPPTAVEWLEQLDNAIGDPTTMRPTADSRVVILAPSGAEVYVDDERKGSVGRSGRVILTAIAPGRHVLRVARLGDHDDERVIEIRPDGAEQIIQAQLKSDPSSGVHLTPSRGGSLGSNAGTHASVPGVVACTRCHSRFAADAKFCGRCGNTTFAAVLDQPQQPPARITPPTTNTITCPRCNTRYLAGTKFCGKCGIPIGVSAIEWKAPKPVEIFCPTCGTSYSAVTKFCGRCGRPINP
jgi:NADH pyrophosphatase NudC (nudix superfamily)